MMTLFDNNTLFRSAMTPGNSPKMLFYQIKQYQEIQCVRKIPYLKDQIIVAAICILVQSNIFPLKEFNRWEAMATKTYPALKMFIHKVYGCHLTAMELRNMSGQNGYGLKQNIHNILDCANDTDNNRVTMVTQAATTAPNTASNLHTANTAHTNASNIIPPET
jgi:hypothetical protein